MTTITVNSAAALTTALSNAHAGDVIALASGTYSNVVIYNRHFTAPVTITSADPTHAAIISGLNVNQSSGLTFSQLQISPNGGLNTWAAQVNNSSQVSFSHIDFSGNSTISPSSRASGLIVQLSSNISVQNSHFQYLNTGIGELNNNNILLSNNAFDHLATDGIENGGSSSVTISNNDFTDFQSPVGGNHPDCIQFWTSNTKTVAHDITLTGNVYDRGVGTPAQGIYVNDEVGTLPYNNVTITNNVILGGDWDGIDVSHATGTVVITGNTVASWAGIDTNTGVMLNTMTSRIMLGNVSGATVQETGNSTQTFILGNSTLNSLGGNSTIGSVTDNGASLMQAWANGHAAQLPGFSTDFLSLLGAHSSTIHSTVGLGS